MVWKRGMFKLSPFGQENLNSPRVMVLCEGARWQSPHWSACALFICLLLLIPLLLFLTPEQDKFIISQGELLVKISLIHSKPAGWTQWYCWKYFIYFYIHLSDDLKDMKYCHFPWTGTGFWLYVCFSEKYFKLTLSQKLLPCFIVIYISLPSWIERVYSEHI